MKQAHRQCAVHPESSDFAYILVYDPGSRNNKAFRMRTLPFGSVRSVHGFLRVSTCIYAIAASEFGVPITSYFDDFIAVCEEAEARSVEGCVTGCRVR